MLRAFRITLMWLIAFAVPVQGCASATMLACGAGHHGGMAASAMVIADAHAQGAHHSQGGAAHKATKGKCAPCASCCVIAGLPATVIRVEPVPLVDLFVPLEPTRIGTFLTDGLDRPPRPFLA